MRHAALFAGKARGQRKLRQEVFAVTGERLIAAARGFWHRFTHHLRQSLVLITGHRFQVELHRHLLRLILRLNALRGFGLFHNHVSQTEAFTGGHLLRNLLVIHAGVETR